jgi:hypothetical protein
MTECLWPCSKSSPLGTILSMADPVQTFTYYECFTYVRLLFISHPHQDFQDGLFPGDEEVSVTVRQLLIFNFNTSRDC